MVHHEPPCSGFVSSGSLQHPRHVEVKWSVVGVCGTEPYEASSAALAFSIAS
ncbi:MAG: hypothetical protein LF888_01130 [Candidatus Megaira endosymbiont of Mesostigma viride]|nr:MAG: hypothetical protein LF888_01130 [Candidatus Megaira endosymbiont of Mesostigma viride]HJK88064.1 hypothetical protein [Candidatus Megaira endosymbiont of Mesostigma viride]